MLVSIYFYINKSILILLTFNKKIRDAELTTTRTCKINFKGYAQFIRRIPQLL